jgi:hypothetical protein
MVDSVAGAYNAVRQESFPQEISERWPSPDPIVMVREASEQNLADRRLELQPTLVEVFGKPFASKGAVERVWESSAALQRSSLGRSLVVFIDPQRRVPKDGSRHLWTIR